MKWTVVNYDEGCGLRPYQEDDEEDSSREVFENKTDAKREALLILRNARKRLAEMVTKVIQA